MSDELIAGLVIGVLVGGCLGWAAATLRAGRIRADDQAAARAREVAAGEQVSALRAELAVAQAQLAGERVGAAQQQAAWAEVRRMLVGEFAELSQTALSQASSQFLQLAESRLRQAQQLAAADLGERTRAVDQVLAPLRDQLARYEEGLRRLERDRQSAYDGLAHQVQELARSQDRLQVETRNLVTALRAPATRGRWGELQLRRVVEMAGMVEHCDFDEQVHTAKGNDSQAPAQRPDLVVHLAGGRHVVVDAKVPLQAFLEAAQCEDDEQQRTRLAAHARQLRAHVDTLAKKAYWQQFDPSPDFVVAFVPGDALLAAALQHDAGLLEHAMANQVLLATPTTLMALLKSVAYGWQHQAMAANAQEVAQLGRELYRRLAVFGEHLAHLGKTLRSTVGAYNDAVGSLERSVLPQARRFPDLGVVSEADRPIPELAGVDLALRPVTGSDDPIRVAPGKEGHAVSQ